MVYERISETGTALTLADAKEHLRIFHDEQDTLIQHYINAAKREIERRTNVAMLPGVVEFRMSNFAARAVFPLKPVNSITKVEYYDTDDNLTTVSTDNYTFSKSWPRQRDQIKFLDFPGVNNDREHAVIITAAVGYTEPPADIYAAMLLVVGKLFNNPSDPVAEKMTIVDKLCRAYV